MATNYPGAIDSLTNPSAGDALTSPSHSAQHANANDAIKAIETELGTDPSGASATVKARFEAIEANDWVTSARIAADAVGSSELADNAVDTNAIQDGAVTSAKVADGAITAAKMQRQVGNLLTDNQASGGDALGNTTGFATWNAEPSYSGGRIVGTKNVGPGTGWGVAINPKAAVTAGETYTVYAEVERLTAAGTAATLWWSDVSNNSLGGVSITPYSTASGVVTGKVTVAAPANAVWAELTVYGSDADANGSTIAVHKVGVWRGKGGQWSLPGTPVLGLEDGLAKVGNLLTDNQASGGDALGNTTGFATWNAEPSYSGGRIVGTKNVGPGTGWGVAINPKAAVTPGETYTIYAQSERLTGAGISTTLWWSDASNNSLGGVSVISWTTATGVQTGQIVATAPANAAWAEVFTYGADADANGSTVAVHKVGLWRGAGGQWAMPGEPIRGLTDAPLGNLLTLNQANPVTTGGYGVDAGAETGIGVYTAAGTVAMSVIPPNATPVVAGEPYTLTANLAPVGRDARVLLEFRTAANANTGGYPTGNVIAASGTGRSTLTVVAPSDAATAVPYVAYTTVGAGGDTVTVTKAGLWKGASGKWALPGVPITGQSRIAVNNAVDLSGTGSPEGVVTAAPGSTWLQTDATTDVKGWIKWVKATGTGNTGWVAGPEADTGWRLVTAALGSASDLLVRRQGRLISVKSTTYTAPGGGLSYGTGFYSPPTGFRNTRQESGVGRNGTSGSVVVVTGDETYGLYFLATLAASDPVYFSLSYTTDDAWPSSLPGSAA